MKETMLKDFWHSIRLFLYASRRRLSYARRYFDNALHLSKALNLSLATVLMALTTTASSYQGA